MSKSSFYAVYGPDGVVRRSGSHPADEIQNIQLLPGERLYHGQASPGDTIDATSGLAYTPPPEPGAPPPPDYVLARMAAYPSTASQLDTFWHAMDEGVLPRIEPFYSQIKAVKDAYPKDFVRGDRMLERGTILPPEEVI